MAAAVRFDQVSKKFRRGEIHDSLRDLLSAAFRRLCGRRSTANGDAVFWALRDVCFEAAPGEALGIIGPNGAGKSTALKLLAGILRADGGSIEVNGRLSALIEVGAGMHGDLTGLENIYLSGSIMGMGRSEIRRKLDDIVAFAGLEKFLDTPVKRYSTGMQARLGFATAAHVSPDVLLVDEVLSVGDAAFRHRCEQRMTELVKSGACLIFVTHNLEQMRQICDRTLVLDHGRCTYLGDPPAAIDHYLRATMNTNGAVGYTDQPHDEHSGVEVLDLVYRSADGSPIACADAHGPLHIDVSLRANRHVPRMAVQVALRHVGGDLFISMNSQHQNVTYDIAPGCHNLTLTMPSIPVSSGTYYAQVRLWDMEACKLSGETPYKYTIQVEDGGKATGMLALPHQWGEATCTTETPNQCLATDDSEATPAASLVAQP